MFEAHGSVKEGTKEFVHEQPHCEVPPPEPSRPSTGEGVGSRRHQSLKQNPRFQRSKGAAPPPSPLPGQRDVDPSVNDLRAQWCWGFSHRRKYVACKVCGREVESTAIEGHLKLCAAGGRGFNVHTNGEHIGASRPTKTAKGAFSNTRKLGQGQMSSENERQEHEGDGTTRHDPDFKNESLHRKKWTGVLDDEEEEGSGLQPQYDPLRGGIYLRLFSNPGDFQQFIEAEHYALHAGGCLGRGHFFPGAPRGPGFPRTSSNDEACFGTAGGAAEFWAQQERRRREQDAEFEKGARAFEHARAQRLEREEQQRSKAESAKRQVCCYLACARRQGFLYLVACLVSCRAAAGSTGGARACRLSCAGATGRGAARTHTTRSRGGKTCSRGTEAKGRGI